MKVLFTMILILILSFLFIETPSSSQNIKILHIHKKVNPFLEMNIRYLNSRIKLSHCDIIMLENKITLDKFEKEQEIEDAQSWEDLKIKLIDNDSLTVNE